MSDWNNDYSFAGPGYKRRMQEERAARKREAAETEARTKPKIVRERLPEPAKRRRVKEKAERPEYQDVSGNDLRRAIRRLAVRTQNAREIERLLKKDGIRASLVTISNVRREFLERLKKRA